MESKAHYRLGVGMMLVNAKKQVWVGERINTPNAWQMPQGGIEPHEDPRLAALRELEEETGIPSSDVTIIAESDKWISFDWPQELQKILWDGLYIGQCQKWYLMRLNTDKDITNLKVDSPEFSAHKWVNVDELLSLIVTFKKNMYNQIINEFAWYFHDRPKS
ncbi:MAG: RNA pyrophosphohydrolase [Candidatus Paracaedibacteraceae bacterium]|nr:RNA pyrophosphohydrolase [Candidatus Paracaedibacteraceae bacterium]